MTETRTSFGEGSADAIGYMEEHNQACECAKASRDLIALQFLACLEPGNEDWTLAARVLAHWTRRHRDDRSCQNCTEEMQDDRHLAQQR